MALVEALNVDIKKIEQQQKKLEVQKQQKQQSSKCTNCKHPKF